MEYCSVILLSFSFPPSLIKYQQESLFNQENVFLGRNIFICNSEQEAKILGRKAKRSWQGCYKAVLLFKRYTLEFEFDRHLVLMVSYQGMESVRRVFIVDDSALSGYFLQKWLSGKTWFFIFLQLQTSKT